MKGMHDGLLSTLRIKRVSIYAEDSTDTILSK